MKQQQGVFTFNPPFNSNNDTGSFEVVGMKRISEYVADKINFFELIYRPNEIPLTTYNHHMEQNVWVYELRTNNKILYIPDPYISTKPDMGTIEYKQYAVTIDIGKLNSRESNLLLPLKNELETLITHTLGVKPEITTFDYGKPLELTQSEASTQDVSRKLLQALDNTKLKNVQYEQEIVTLKKEIEDMRCVINATF